MKRFTVLILLIVLYLTTYSQTVKGVVLDRYTHDEVSFATVYFDGTFVGTCSDIHGKFWLKIGYNTCMPLMVSAIGYYTETLLEFSTDSSITIYLTPKNYNIKDVIVSEKSLVKKRKDNMKLFKEIFLGTTRNALGCEITNPEDIKFNYDSDKDTLRAFASNPIHIINKELGYVLTCYLDNFEYYRKSQSFLFISNNIFNEDLATSNADKHLYDLKREKAYLGSRMHFFRALWQDNLSSEGFVVTNSSNKQLTFYEIVSQELNSLLGSELSIKKYLEYHGNLIITFNSSSSEISFTKTKVFFDENGYFDLGIDWNGEMVKRRIGDLLPFNYVLIR